MNQEVWDREWMKVYATEMKHAPDPRRANRIAHTTMVRAFGPRPKATPGPPWWLKIGGGAIGVDMSLIKGVWKWLNGKKVLIASILVGVPVIWDVLDDILIAGGVGEGTVVAIGGTVLLIVGWAHKILKVLGVAEKPKE